MADVTVLDHTRPAWDIAHDEGRFARLGITSANVLDKLAEAASEVAGWGAAWPIGSSGKKSTTAKPVLEFSDNRLSGLLREVQEAIEQEDDPVTLRRLGVSLKLLHDKARGRGWELQKPTGNRTY